MNNSNSSQNSSSMGLTGPVGLCVALIMSGVLAVEGGFVNNKKDPGGPTNHGITQQVAKAHGYKGSMKDLPEDYAKQIYYEDYVVKPNYLPLVELQPAVAEKLINTAINTGPVLPSRWFQQSLNAFSRGGEDYPQIQVDGKIGQGTLNNYKALEAKRGKAKACQLVIKLLDAQQAMYYMSLKSENTFTVGWIDNRIQNVPLSKCKDE